jgi:predicted phage-related endonuclease
MSQNEIITKIESLQEWEELAAQAAAEIESLRDTLKKFMDDQGVEEYATGTHIIRWTTVLSNRFDSTSFKREHAEMYLEYTKQSTSRRFTISR